MYPPGNLFIPAPHGRLEAIIKEPRTAMPVGVALVLHPHPLHGGTMHNKVVYRAARALLEAGLITLRVNFRGVGLSTGTHDNARGEQDDARAALDYLLEKHPSLSVTLAGFSFGARVGLEVGTSEKRVDHLIGIGTPVNMYDFGFLKRVRKPLLLVHGEKDEFGDAKQLQTLAAELPTEARTRVEIISNAGHFFEGHLDEMSCVIANWVKELIQ